MATTENRPGEGEGARGERRAAGGAARNARLGMHARIGSDGYGGCEILFGAKKWLWLKKPEFQNGTLVSGNMDQNLRFAPPIV